MAYKQQTPPEITDDVKRTWPRIRHDHSAGGVAYRHIPETEEFEIALIATRGGTRWQLPKGSTEIGETSIETAIREVEEEVGLVTEHQAMLKIIEYWYWDTYCKEVPELVHKEVDFYLLRIIGGELSDESYEVDGVAWFTVDQARDVLTFDGEKVVLELAYAALKRAGEHNRVSDENPLA